MSRATSRITASVIARYPDKGLPWILSHHGNFPRAPDDKTLKDPTQDTICDGLREMAFKVYSNYIDLMPSGFQTGLHSQTDGSQKILLLSSQAYASVVK